METILNNNQPIDEMCPCCEQEVQLKPVFSVQVCPCCGELILPCNLCDHDTCDCAHCPLEQIRLDIQNRALSKY
jgi:hypothetical protein